MKMRTIGIDLGGTTASFIDMFSPDDVLAEIQINTPSSIDGVLGGLAKTVAGLISSNKDPRPAGLGVAIAGQVDHMKKSIIFSPHLPFKEEFPLGGELKKRIGIPVYLENDANAAAIGEKVFGAAAEMDDFISITLGTGLGSGIFTGGSLLRGGEAGHITIDPDGPPCNCGNRGCLETFCTGKALRRMAEERLGVPKSGRELCAAAVDGDEGAIKILREAGERLGDGLVSLVNIFNPEAIFFSGSLANAPEVYFEPAFRKAREKSFGTFGQNLRLEISRFKDNIGVIGAAALCAERCW